MSFLIDYLHHTVNQQRPIVHNRNLDICHAILRWESINFSRRRACGYRVLSEERRQYLGTDGSTSSDHARIPPFRFRTLRKPACRRKSTASAERFPLRQWVTISRELSMSLTRRERSPSGIK